MTADTPDARSAGSSFAWLGAALFAASLGWFVFSYFVRFPALASVGRHGGPLAWNVALFTAFAAHHSLFARDAVRVRIERAVPRPRAVGLRLGGQPACSWRSAPRGAPCRESSWTVERRGRVDALCARASAGIVLTLRAAAILDVWELAGTRPPRHAPGAHGGDATFTRRGPYGWVRHPIYSGWFLVVFAVPVMTATQLVFAVVSSAYLVDRDGVRGALARAPRAPEDGVSRKYQRDVRWKVIPGESLKSGGSGRSAGPA